MQRGFGGTTFEPVQPERRDREFTLGPFLLTFIGCGLFALCGLCFVFGYSVGHRNAESSSTISVPPPAATALSQPATPQAKPAAGQSGNEPQPPVDATDNSAASPTGSDGTTPQASTSGASASPTDPGVRTVPVAQPIAQPPAASATVQPALASQVSGIMVQIAAVSHPEDADVLVSALRKRGYAVAAHRDPTDGLLHVQIGPFANRNDAYAMRQKLLNDGYNAIVQP